ncbi:hypothetical protein Pmani_036503 [Petrolisthes manimaculis]|uniref:Uncharacterized protein n=1 Tax=Petrolisthes manimaculis TaxID=1843537 RepID=A0AAE1NJL0_9EUCA|nr:hypothetical protein Pmani_036503 [Petrolisthes manimaculis]
MTHTKEEQKTWQRKTLMGMATWGMNGGVDVVVVVVMEKGRKWDERNWGREGGGGEGGELGEGVGRVDVVVVVVVEGGEGVGESGGEEESGEGGRVGGQSQPGVEGWKQYNQIELRRDMSRSVGLRSYR